MNTNDERARLERAEELLRKARGVWVDPNSPTGKSIDAFLAESAEPIPHDWGEYPNGKILCNSCRAEREPEGRRRKDWREIKTWKRADRSGWYALDGYGTTTTFRVGQRRTQRAKRKAADEALKVMFWDSKSVYLLGLRCNPKEE